MYDLWYSLGTAVMNPALITTISTAIQNAGKPCFNLLKSRLFTEVQPDGSTTLILNKTTAGLLDLDVLPAVRAAIRTFFQAAPGAPPVSLYAAGKLSQFLAVDVIDSQSVHGKLDFSDIINLANQAVTAVGGGANVSAAFTALLGLCLIDETARSVTAGNAAPKPAVLNEFGLANVGEIARITSIVGHPNFMDAQKSFLEGDNNTWDPSESSSEQFFTWAGGHNERAVF